MHERQRFERELEDLDPREYQGSAPVPPATIGFEFDVHYGLVSEVVTAAGKAMPVNNALVTDHGDANDGFRVKRDGPRLEIATKPFTLNTAGKTEIDETKKKIVKFAAELQAGCRGAAEQSIAVPGVSGKPRPFTHPRTVVKDLPLVKLPFDRKFPTAANCAVWASPQATITIPLSKVGELVQAIKSTEGKGAGIALTGGSGTRMGVQSLAIYKAKAAVDKVWRELVTATPRIKLTDAAATEVNRTTFTDNLRGFLILLASYLWTSELPYRVPTGDARKGEDYEPFAKAYLPLNVKAPFSAIFRELLTDTERQMFRELFAEGTARRRMFRLAKRDAELADGSKLLFPPGPKEGTEDSVHRRQTLEFGTAPTWNDLLAHTLNPAHKGWGDRLMVPLSHTIPLSVTKPRVAMELRRIGWASVFAKQWPGMIDRIVRMAERLNA